MRFDITIYHFSDSPGKWEYEVSFFDVKDPVRMFHNKVASGEEGSLDAALNAARRTIEEANGPDSSLGGVNADEI